MRTNLSLLYEACRLAGLGLALLSRPAVGQVDYPGPAWNQGRYGAVPAAYRLGALATWGGNLDSALIYLARARAADPNDPNVRAMQAQVLTWTGRYPEALVQWDSLIANHPERIDGLVGKALTLAWNGRSAEADSLYDAALARDPTNAEALDGRAQLAYWDGRTAEAIAGYERALSYRRDDVVARIGLAQAYRTGGRQWDAIAEADSAVAIAPGNREAHWTQTDVGRTTVATVDLSLGWSDDSDDNTMWWQIVAAATPVSNRVRGFGSVGFYQGTSTPAVSASRGSAEFGATFSQTTWQLTAAFGAQGLWPDTGLSRSVLTGRLGVAYRVHPSIGFGVSYAHFPYVETASLIGAGLDVDAVDGALDATLGPGLTLDVGGGAGWFSDGNVRTSFVISATKQLPRYFFAGGRVQLAWYEEQEVGYFSPGRFAVVEARAGYTRIGRRWETWVSAGAGVQQIDLDGTWQFEGQLEGRAAYWFSKRNRMEAFAGATNSAFVSATGAQQWATAGIALRFGL